MRLLWKKIVAWMEENYPDDVTQMMHTLTVIDIFQSDVNR